MSKSNKLAVFTMVFLVSVWLSASAYHARNHLQVLQTQETAVSPNAISFSPLSRSQLPLRTAQASQSEAAELRARLDFMVFAKERREAQVALVEVLHAQINRAPFDRALWRDLVFAKQGIEITDAETKSTFEIAKKLSRWSVNERILLLNRCVQQYQVLTKISPSLCSDLFDNLPMRHNVRRLSSLMGVEYHYLLNFLTGLGLEVSGDQSP